MLNLDYDEKFDILNVSLSDSSNSIGCEEYGGLVVMRDLVTREVTGLMLYGFAEKYKMDCIPHFPDGVTITVEKDIIPALSNTIVWPEVRVS